MVCIADGLSLKEAKKNVESATCAERTKLQSRSLAIAFTDWSRDQLSEEAGAAERNAAKKSATR